MGSVLLSGVLPKALAKELPGDSIVSSAAPGIDCRDGKEAAKVHHDMDCDATHTTIATKESYDDTATTATSISDGEQEDNHNVDAAALLPDPSLLDSLSFDDVPTGGLILLPRTSRCWLGREPNEAASRIDNAGSDPATPPPHHHPVVDLHVECPNPPPAPSTDDDGAWNGEEDMYVTPKAAVVGCDSFPSTPPTPKHCQMARVVVFFDAGSPLPENLMIPEV
jgi:hypothetical protein